MIWGFLATGLIVGGSLLALTFWLRKQNATVNWYEWVIGAIGLLMLLFTLQNFFASFVEREASAAYMFLLVTGLPAIILLAVAWQLVARRQRAA